MSSIIHANAAKSNKKLSDMKKGEKLTRTRLNPNKKKNEQNESKSPSPSPPKNRNKKQENTLSFIDNLLKNLDIDIHHRKWEDLALALFTFLFIVFPIAFRFFNRTIISPSESTIKREINKHKIKYTPNLIDISKVGDIINEYKTRNNLNENESIDGVLAVDALSLTPHITIDKEGKFQGLLKNVQLNKEEINKIKRAVEYQEALIKDLRKDTITDAFVFQYQPLNPKYKTFVLHIMGSHGGKASEKQIRVLSDLALMLSLHRMNVFAYASDGDSGYRPLVNSMIERWESTLDTTIKYPPKLYTNDPLHVLKRARYRGLSHILYSINESSNAINLSSLQGVLNLPEVVFMNNKITKMHDIYPIRLFSLESFLKLYEFDLLDYCAFFLPFTLLQVSLTEPKLTVHERADLIEITIYYLHYYKEMYNKTPSEYKITNNKERGPLFDNALINDMLATCLTILSAMNTFKGKICFNRIGTNPLEHHFGLLRIKSKYNDDFETLLSAETKAQILDDLEHQIIGGSIKSRRSSYGVDVDLDYTIYGNNYGMNHKVAIAMLKEFGFPTFWLSSEISDTESEFHSQFLWNLLIKTFLNEDEKNFKFILDSKKLTKFPSSGRNIRCRQNNKKI